MEEDILGNARRKHEEYLEEKIDKRIFGEGEGTHIFVWTKRIINILNERGKLTVQQIADILLKNYPKDYEKLPEGEIMNSIRSILKSLSKKERLENIRGIDINVVYGHGLKLKNNGEYWWIETIKMRPEKQMQNILDLFKKK